MDPPMWFSRRKSRIALALLVLLAVLSGGAVALYGSWERLPGIPTGASSERTQFEASFWPGLYSGIIAGVVTGLLVGIVVGGILLAAEQRLAANYESRHQLQALEEFKASVWRSSGLVMPAMYVPRKAADAISVGASRIFQSSEQKPFLLWLQLFDSEQDFLRLIFDLLGHVESFNRTAEILDEALLIFVNDYNRQFLEGSKGIIEEQQIRYILGRVLGLETPIVLSLIGGTPPEKVLEDVYEKVVAESKLTMPLERYLQYLEGTREALQKLETHLTRDWGTAQATDQTP